MQYHQGTEDRDISEQAYLCITLFKPHFTPWKTVFPSSRWKLQRPFLWGKGQEPKA